MSPTFQRKRIPSTQSKFGMDPMAREKDTNLLVL